MKKYIIGILILFSSFDFWAQQNDFYIIATIEKKTTNKLHPLEFDYWIVSLSEWKESDDPFMPLYLNDFSKTDINECCKRDTLILFNYSANDTFDFDDSFLKSINHLQSSIKAEREKVQTIKKKWDGYKEEITVYLTPIKGIFCICELKHKDDNSKIGYHGKAAIPYGKFEINREIKDSQEFKEIMRYDFSTLPFLSLQNIQ